MPSNFRASVIKGAGRGKELGFPTINLTASAEMGVKPGIHICKARLNETWYWGVLFFGPRPVFGEEALSLEVHLLDFNEDTEVPTQLEVEVLKYLRPVYDFATVEELIEQMKEDVKRAKEYISSERLY